MQYIAGTLYLTGAFFLAGTSVIAGRMVANTLGSFTITAVSLFFALLVLLPLCGSKVTKTIRELSGREWLEFLLQALFGIFLFRLFLLQGLLRTSAGEAGILTGTTPAVTALLAWGILKERLDLMKITGICSTVTGILVLQGIFSAEISFSVTHSIGNILVMCAAACESLFNILSRITSVKALADKRKTTDPLVQTTLVAGIALLFCLIPVGYEQPFRSLLQLEMTGWLALVWYGVFVTAVAFIFWYAGIRRCDASVAAAFSGMMPFTSLVLSVLLLDEQPGWLQWLGGTAVVMGMVLSGIPSPRKSDSKKALPQVADRQ